MSGKDISRSVYHADTIPQNVQLKSVFARNGKQGVNTPMTAAITVCAAILYFGFIA